jgi:hypothetical protein
MAAPLLGHHQLLDAEVPPHAYIVDNALFRNAAGQVDPGVPLREDGLGHPELPHNAGVVVRDDLHVDGFDPKILQRHRGQDAGRDVVAGAYHGSVRRLRADLLQHGRLSPVPHRCSGAARRNVVDGLLVDVDGDDVVAVAVERLRDAGPKVAEAYNDKSVHEV